MRAARLSRLCVLLVASVVAASCTAPVPTPPLPVRTTDIVLVPDTETVQGRVPQNATLDMLIKASGVRADQVPSIVAAARAVVDPRTIRAGHAFRLVRTLDGWLRSFEYEIDIDRYLWIEAPPQGAPGSLSAGVRPYQQERTVVTAWGAIGRESPSLVEAMAAAGEGPELALALADVFGADIDFNTDLQVGDTFGVAFEKILREGVQVGYGAVVAAEFQNAGRRLVGVRFTPPGGKPGYYDAEGRSLRRFFLKSPLKFAPRVSSGFSNRRLHPILRIYRPHLGVDYVAPMGAPVQAVAAGVVVAAGWSGEGGRTVHLRHPNGYETLYMHLSSVAVRAGQRVAQGDLIGRVGSSGLATGPHLDYRIRRNGAYVNPVLEHKRMPPGEPVPAAFMSLFEAARDQALARLAIADPPRSPAPPR